MPPLRRKQTLCVKYVFLSAESLLMNNFDFVNNNFKAFLRDIFLHILLTLSLCMSVNVLHRFNGVHSISDQNWPGSIVCLSALNFISISCENLLATLATVTNLIGD